MHTRMFEHIGHAFFSFLSPPISLRRIDPVRPFRRFGDSTGGLALSPLVWGRVSVTRGYKPCFGRLTAPKRTTRHRLASARI